MKSKSPSWKKEFPMRSFIIVRGVGFMVCNIGRRSITLRRVYPENRREESPIEIEKEKEKHEQ